MEKHEFSRQYLESISTADLISLANDYGIDIPSNLTRRFIIGELMELFEELENDAKSDNDVQLTDDDVSLPDTLPKSYNETQIFAVQRNPAWIFVFWDISESQLSKLRNDANFEGLLLHVAFFDTVTDDIPDDSFDISISEEDREQYVYIPAGKKYVIINLKCKFDGGEPKVLAYTKRLEIPQEGSAVSSLQPGQKLEMSKLEKLSGMEEIINNHYRKHRQSFS